METGYDGERVINVGLQFPDERTYTASFPSALVHDLRRPSRGVPGHRRHHRAPAHRRRRRAAVSPERRASVPAQQPRDALLHVGGGQLLRHAWHPAAARTGFSAKADGQTERAVILSESAARRSACRWGQDPIRQERAWGRTRNTTRNRPASTTARQVIGISRDRRAVMMDGSDNQQIYMPLPEERIQDYPMLVRTHATADPVSVMRAIEPAIAAADPNLTATMTTPWAMLRQTDFVPRRSVGGDRDGHQPVRSAAGTIGIYSTVSYDVVLRTREVGNLHGHRRPANGTSCC